MLYFDILPVELLHQILYNILTFDDMESLYKSGSVIDRKVFDDPMYWEGTIRHYIIPFTIDYNEYKNVNTYEGYDFTDRQKSRAKYTIDYTDKFYIDINYKNISSRLLNYKSNKGFYNLISFRQLLGAHGCVIDFIKSRIKSYFANPETELPISSEEKLNKINDLELLCPSCFSYNEIRFLRSCRATATYVYNAEVYGVKIFIGRYFHFQLFASGYQGHIYEVRLQNVFDLLLHIYCNYMLLIKGINSK